MFKVHCNSCGCLLTVEPDDVWGYDDETGEEIYLCISCWLQTQTP